MNHLYSAIYDIVRLVPYGRVTSYGAIAKCLGVAGGARFVGWAMNASHQVLPSVPAHRVVNRNGMLTGKHHFPQTESMQQRLEEEGILVVDDKIVDFERLFWNPMTELEL
jgi:methylated-DNA-protein-cysteine methyltransferase related protein